jgi:hypothetical protein
MIQAKRLDSVPREIGKLTTEQLAKWRNARAAREELFRRISDEAQSTASTFEQTASRLGTPHRVVEYFQAERDLAIKTLSDGPESNATSQRENFARRFTSWVLSFLRTNQRAVLPCLVLLTILGFGALQVIFFRFDVKTTTSLVVVRMDRLTGEIEWCYPRRGCSSTIR